MCQSRLLRLAQQARKAILPDHCYCCNHPMEVPSSFKCAASYKGQATKWTTSSPEPLAISRMTPVIGRTSRMKSRYRSVAGAYWRPSPPFLLTHSWNFGRRITEGARAVAAEGDADIRERPR